jgi:hypothetical protein
VTLIESSSDGMTLEWRSPDVAAGVAQLGLLDLEPVSRSGTGGMLDLHPTVRHDSISWTWDQTCAGVRIASGNGGSERFIRADGRSTIAWELADALEVTPFDGANRDGVTTMVIRPDPPPRRFEFQRTGGTIAATAADVEGFPPLLLQALQLENDRLSVIASAPIRRGRMLIAELALARDFDGYLAVVANRPTRISVVDVCRHRPRQMQFTEHDGGAFEFIESKLRQRHPAAATDSLTRWPTRSRKRLAAIEEVLRKAAANVPWQFADNRTVAYRMAVLLALNVPASRVAAVSAALDGDSFAAAIRRTWSWFPADPLDRPEAIAWLMRHLEDRYAHVVAADPWRGEPAAVRLREIAVDRDLAMRCRERVRVGSAIAAGLDEILDEQLAYVEGRQATYATKSAALRDIEIHLDAQSRAGDVDPNEPEPDLRDRHEVWQIAREQQAGWRAQVLSILRFWHTASWRSAVDPPDTAALNSELSRIEKPDVPRPGVVHVGDPARLLAAVDQVLDGRGLASKDPLLSAISRVLCDVVRPGALDCIALHAQIAAAEQARSRAQQLNTVFPRFAPTETLNERARHASEFLDFYDQLDVRSQKLAAILGSGFGTIAFQCLVSINDPKLQQWFASIEEERRALGNANWVRGAAVVVPSIVAYHTSRETLERWGEAVESVLGAVEELRRAQSSLAYRAAASFKLIEADVADLKRRGHATDDVLRLVEACRLGGASDIDAVRELQRLVASIRDTGEVS